MEMVLWKATTKCVKQNVKEKGENLKVRIKCDKMKQMWKWVKGCGFTFHSLKYILLPIKLGILLEKTMDGLDYIFILYQMY